MWVAELPGSVVVEEMPGSVWVLDGDSVPPYIVPIPRVVALLSGEGSLSASLRIRQLVALSGFGVLSASIVQKYEADADLTGAGVLSGARTGRMVRAAALSGEGSLSAVRSLRSVRAAALSGEGSLSAVVRAQVVTAGLSGVGVLSCIVESVGGSIPVLLSGEGVLAGTRVLRMTRTVALSGAGVLSAAAIPRRSVSVSLSGAGALSAARVDRAMVAALSGVGTLSAVAIAQIIVGEDDTSQPIPIPRTIPFVVGERSAATGVKTTRLSGTGTLSAVSFYAQGMNKVGDHNVNSTNGKVTGWSGRANSSVINDSLVVVGAAKVTVNFRVQFTQASSHSAQLFRNGVQVATSNSLSNAAGVVNGSVTLTVAPGDVFELYALSSSALRSNVSTNTFVELAPSA